MDFSGTYLILADRMRVWRALNDTNVLKQAIPRCQNIKWSSANTLDLTIQVNLGVMRPKFSGELTLSNITEAKKYTLSGRGRGGVLGLAHGSADIELVDYDITRSERASLNVDGYWPQSVCEQTHEFQSLSVQDNIRDNIQDNIHDNALSLGDIATGTLLKFAANGGASKHIMALGKTIVGKSAQRIIDRFMGRFCDAMDAPMLPRNEIPENQI